MILRELLSQFLTAISVISAILIVSQLVRISEVIATFGLSLENIFLPFLFLLMPFLPFMIPIAYLFAVMLSFSRLSADGEYIAMIANGYSLKKICQPVMTLGLGLSLIGALLATHMEAWARRETVSFSQRKAQTEVDNLIRSKLYPGIFLDNFLGYVLFAEKISVDKTQFERVMLGPGPGREDQRFTLIAPKASLMGAVERGALKMSFEEGWIYSESETQEDATVVKFKRAELDLLAIFQDQIFGSDSVRQDYRSYKPVQLWHYLAQLRDELHNDPHKEDLKQIYAKADYLFHKRLGMPFASLFFAGFGMTLGIFDERRGKNRGFTGAILIIIIAYVILMWFQWLSERQHLGALPAVWLPNLFIGVISGFFLYLRHLLPPSESVLNWRHWPFVQRLAKAAKNEGLD